MRRHNQGYGGGHGHHYNGSYHYNNNVYGSGGVLVPLLLGAAIGTTIGLGLGSHA
jgi:hypothetical protein